MRNKPFEFLLDELEQEAGCSSMLGLCQIGIALKVIEDRMWNYNDKIAQRCNDIQHKIFGEIKK